MAAAGKRRSDKDVLKLIESNYEVNLNNGLKKFTVKFHGPANTLYENGVWKIRVELTDRYPFEPPSISFVNKIYHPNIDEVSGNICLDVLNQKWSAMFDLINIFETFLPQLLTYPNPKDPLNSEAGIMYEEDTQAYQSRVRDYIERYAFDPSLVTRDDDDDNKRFRGNPEDSPASPKQEPKTPETEEEHYSSESSMSDDDDAKSDHEYAAAAAGSSAGQRNKAGQSSEPRKQPPSATITSPVDGDDDDDDNTIEDDQYLEHFNYVNNYEEAKD